MCRQWKPPFPDPGSATESHWAGVGIAGVTQVQWMANSTMNIMKSRITMEPNLLSVKSLVWVAGSTVGVALLDFDCIVTHTKNVEGWL